MIRCFTSYHTVCIFNHYLLKSKSSFLKSEERGNPKCSLLRSSQCRTCCMTRYFNIFITKLADVFETEFQHLFLGQCTDFVCSMQIETGLRILFFCVRGCVQKSFRASVGIFPLLVTHSLHIYAYSCVSNNNFGPHIKLFTGFNV